MEKEQAQAKAPEIIPGGMTTNCMLVKLTVTGWDARIKDKHLTKDTAERHGIAQKGKKDRVRVYKTLVDPERIDELEAMENAIRAYHYTMTLPWLDKGPRLITAKAFPSYNRTIHSMIEAYLGLAKALKRDFFDLKAQARIDLNGNYRESEYPSLEELDRKYSADVSYAPVPTSGDIRVAIQDDALAKIKADLEDREKAATATALKDVWTRIHKAVGHMAGVLANDQGKFHDTLVGNLVELVNLLPVLNWTDDPVMDRARRDIEAQLCAYDPQTLRDDPKARKETAKAASQVAATAKAKLDELESLVGDFF